MGRGDGHDDARFVRDHPPGRQTCGQEIRGREGLAFALVQADDRQALTGRRVARIRRRERDKGIEIGFPDEGLRRIEQDHLDEDFWVPRSTLS
jgi:hypothetical protein